MDEQPVEHSKIVPDVSEVSPDELADLGSRLRCLGQELDHTRQRLFRREEELAAVHRHLKELERANSEWSTELQHELNRASTYAAQTIAANNASWQSQLEAANNQHHELRRQNLKLSADLAAVWNSSSWRLTAPVRRLISLFKTV